MYLAQTTAGWGTSVKGLIALITDLLQLLQLLLQFSLTIARSQLFSCMGWFVSKHKIFCFKKTPKVFPL